MAYNGTILTCCAVLNFPWNCPSYSYPKVTLTVILPAVLGFCLAMSSPAECLAMERKGVQNIAVHTDDWHGKKDVVHLF